MLRDMLLRPLLKMDLRKEGFALLPKRFFVFHLRPFVFSFFLFCLFLIPKGPWELLLLQH